MPAARRRRLPQAGSPSSRSHSHGHERSFVKMLNSYLNKWMKKTGTTTGKKSSLRPPASFLVKGLNESDVESADDGKQRQPSLSLSVVLKALVSARVCSALWSNIQDCDEVFNYWEPSHFLLTGRGFETWEYSPNFAIRSYAYIWLYTIPAIICSRLFAVSNLTMTFYIVRLFMAICCSFCEVYFLKGVSNVFGPFVTRICFAVQLFSTGMFISTTAFLPSSFSMYMTMVVFGAWMNRHVKTSIVATVVSIFVGWPFAGIVSVPVGLHMLLSGNSVPGARKKHYRDKIIISLTYLAKWTIIFAFVIAGILVVIDSIHYGKIVFAPLNIVMYNVFSSKGPELYGTEPWFYYPFNLFLNFNIAFVLSIMCLPFSCLVKLISRWISPSATLTVTWHHVIVISSVILWYLVFVPQPHKEERFMYPIFPLICLTAALSLHLTHQLVCWLTPRLSSFVLNVILILLVCSAVISVSRGITLFKGYHAPFDIYSHLEHINDQLLRQNFDGDINLCVGKEWHRFPSSYFLPNSRWKLRFLKSEFSGLLPKPYDESLSGILNRTRHIPSDMNDENREEPSRYLEDPDKNCHFIIDSDYPEHAPLDQPYSKQTDVYEIVTFRTFLDSTRTPFPWRSFYIPILSEKKWSIVDYNLLRNVNLTLNYTVKV